MSGLRLIVATLVLVPASAQADQIISLEQSRLVAAHTTAECEGTVESSIAAQGFGPFEESVQSLQICDEVGTIATADAEQSSAIGETIVSALGAANAGGEGPAGIHAFSSSIFDLTFAIEIPCRYRVTGEVSVAFGFDGGHQAFVRLLGAGDLPIFIDGLVGDGGQPQTLEIDRSGVLIDGPYNLDASALISPADLTEQIPWPSASYDMTFELFDLADINVDGSVNVLDLLELLESWGPCPDPPKECLADLNLDGAVNVFDLLALFAGWTG